MKKNVVKLTDIIKKKQSVLSPYLKPLPNSGTKKNLTSTPAPYRKMKMFSALQAHDEERRKFQTSIQNASIKKRDEVVPIVTISFDEEADGEDDLDMSKSNIETIMI